MRVAALDLGSNTFLLLVADFEAGKLKKVIREEIRTTRLGQRVHANREFHKEALERAEKCFSEYSEILKELKPDKVIAMATSAARDVKNGQALFDLGIKYNIPIQIIPGSMEAKVSFEGSTFEIEDSRGVAVIDVGGGSTEVVGKDQDGRLRGHSLDIGSVRLTELFAEDIEKLESYCDEQIVKNKKNLPDKPKTLVAVAGTPVMLSCILQESTYSHDLVHGYKFDIQTLRNLRDRLADISLEKRKTIVGMDPSRADVIVAGSTILLKTAEALGADCIQVSNHGVRYGVAHLAARGEI